MITKRQGFIAYGVPVPQGSMKCVGGGRGRPHQLVDEKAKRLDIWRLQVQRGARQFFTETADQHQPLQLKAMFFIARPATHYRTGRYSDQLREDAPKYPTKKTGGDLDKLVRAIGDALQQSGHIHDDAQFVRFGQTDKLYIAEYPGQPGTLTRPGVIVEVAPR